MAKRFTDSEKWKKPFIKSLSSVHKLFFLYILDDCDHAGIWNVEIEVAEIRIGEKLKIADLKKALKKHIYEFNDGQKWFIPYFIEFQYGELNPENRAHLSVINQLKKYNLLKKYKGLIKGLASPLQEAMDMDKDKAKDKDKEKDKKEAEKYFLDLLPEHLSKNGFVETWKNFVDYRSDKKMNLTKHGARLAINKLIKFEDPKGSILQSIENSWTGLFPVKDKSDTEYGEADKVDKLMELFLDFWNRNNITFRTALANYKSNKHFVKMKEQLKSVYGLTADDLDKKYAACMHRESV